MLQASLLKDIEYGDDKPKVSLLFESDFTKEIRIVFRAGQTMAAHQTSHPITVEIVDGILDFGVASEKHRLGRGDLIALPPNVPHDLHALTDCVVRLTLTRQDQVQRVVNVIKAN